MLSKDETREVQMLLNGHGFGPLTVDGIWGDKTREAVEAFQRSRKLMDDGVVGDKTKAALRGPKQQPQPANEDDAPAPVARGLLLTNGMLDRIAPAARGDLAQAITGNVARLAAGGIDTRMRLAHFLAQICTETGGLKSIEESLNYSADGLMNTFGRHRISAEDCARFGRRAGHPANQEAIANLIYGGTFGAKQLGNTQPGDGWRYRGGGYLQNTGRVNYAKAGYEENPDALRDPVNGLKAALEFWNRNHLNDLADADNIVALRKKVNGGTNGLEEARHYLVKAKAVLF